MYRTIIAIAALILGITSCSSSTDPGNADAPAGVELLHSSLERETKPNASSEEQAKLGQGSREFALSLYAQAANDKPGNVFLSPYSVSVALAMTYAGAKGDTKTELANALHFSVPEPQLHAAWNAVDLALKGRKDELVSQESMGEGLTLEVTNAIFSQTGFTPNQPFLDTLGVSYGAGLYAADFAKDAERARVAINDWTAQRTHDRIQDLLAKDSLKDALLVLLNAIYFKAAWRSPFEVANTKREAFHARGGDVMVEMMHAPGGRYATGDGYQAIELEYISKSVSMFVIVPDAGRFDAIETGLDAAFFDRVHDALSYDYEVALGLPRFKIEGETVGLKKGLEALGMRKAFTQAADFSGIAGAPGDLQVSDVLHQAFVAVDETGTEAAAATAVVFVATSTPPPKKPVTLTIDRPFLFAIYDQPTGQILFLGRLTNPG